MAALLIAAVALVASALTFFSGFGLGTLLLPAFSLWYPVQVAVVSTAVVHFLNSVFKLALVGRHADRGVVLRFGVPAIGAAWLGAWLLLRLAALPPLATYTLAGRPATIHPVKAVIGVLLLAFTAFELRPERAGRSPATPAALTLGGVLSGFFGGLSGLQGALRSAFLVRAGLSTEAYVGTGVAIAALVDVSRLTVYVPSLLRHRGALDLPVLGAAVAAAFAGAMLGNRYLHKVTYTGVQRLVAALLAVFAVGLVAGVL